MDSFNFAYPHHRHCGDSRPDYLRFNANLQEFAGRVEIIVNLATGGKLTQQEAFERIQVLWRVLEQNEFDPPS